MASATPDLRLPSQPQGIIALSPVPNYTACWQRHACEQLAQGCCLKVERSGVKPTTFCVASQHPNHYTTRPHIQGGPKKRGHRLMTIILSNLNRFTKFFTGKFFSKFAVKWHLAYVATLPCEKLMSAKQAINDKLQGSVATYLRCGGVVNNQIKKGLLLSVRVKIFLNRWISGKVTSKNAIVSCTLPKDEETAWDSRVFACNCADYSQILNFFGY